MRTSLPAPPYGWRRRLAKAWNWWMAAALCAGSSLAGSVQAADPDTVTLKTQERNGSLYLSSAELEAKAGIAVKTLPGRQAVVACKADRCALITDFIQDGEVTYVSAAALSRALGAEMKVESATMALELTFASGPSPKVDGIIRVGQLAPDFRLRKVDGSVVALSDFRGRRVLINSWASW